MAAIIKRLVAFPIIVFVSAFFSMSCGQQGKEAKVAEQSKDSVEQTNPLDSYLNESDTSKISPQKIAIAHLWLRNYAFCSFMMNAFPNNMSKADFGKSGAGYFETGVYPVSAYSGVADLAKNWAKKEYQSKDQAPLKTMVGLDFYNSKELDHLISGYDDSISTQADWKWLLDHTQQLKL